MRIIFGLRVAFFLPEIDIAKNTATQSGQIHTLLWVSHLSTIHSRLNGETRKALMPNAATFGPFKSSRAMQELTETTRYDL